MSDALLHDLLDACRRLHAGGLLAASDGNLSMRLPNGLIAMTPSGVPKAKVQLGDLAYLQLDGTIQAGRPSSERAMHLAIYRAVPEAKAIVHAHPPTAIAWSLARPELEELPSDGLPEVILAAGRIPIVPMALPGTEAMGANLLPFLPAHRLMILARHGGLCWGGHMDEAAGGMERLEQVATILWKAETLGGAKPLSVPELEELRALRARLGPKII
ncbi:MAG: class II aldolase/adducin family protein [Geothrix sp.]|uniref:class II aldolase/adducin family protein n=1 Tax=Geothrix sp. TaxID=1962974 RepID=UPI0017EBBDD1|nr:class II aldolase/adducin family protein [Geothrix sp.]NWJ39457.1 class II aldolase/adducin family protein [Geothrix sp.]WIL19319.1 MAG: class II aldolase/adducin family protein [Geothrix sp.]